MERSREVETKLQVATGFTLPDLARVDGVCAVEVERREMSTTYWDTPDLRVIDAGMTLRHRVGEGEPCWTLKTETAEGIGKWELTVRQEGASVPPELLEEVAAVVQDEALGPVVELRTTRLAHRLLDASGAELCEVVDDEVRAHGGTGATWRELEVEERSAPEVTRAVLDLLVSAGASVGDQLGKARRALGLGARKEQP